MTPLFPMTASQIVQMGAMTDDQVWQNLSLCPLTNYNRNMARWAHFLLTYLNGLLSIPLVEVVIPVNHIAMVEKAGFGCRDLGRFPRLGRSSLC